MILTKLYFLQVSRTLLETLKGNQISNQMIYRVHIILVYQFMHTHEKNITDSFFFRIHSVCVQNVDKELVFILVHLFSFLQAFLLFAGLKPKPGALLDYIRTLPILHDADYAKTTDLYKRYPPVTDLSTVCVLP